jgi:hypothetical protein
VGPFACAALLPDGERVNVTAIEDRRGARLLTVRRWKSGRDVLPRLTDHARRSLRDQVETAMYAEQQEGRIC